MRTMPITDPGLPPTTVAVLAELRGLPDVDRVHVLTWLAGFDPALVARAIRAVIRLDSATPPGPKDAG